MNRSERRDAANRYAKRHGMTVNQATSALKADRYVVGSPESRLMFDALRDDFATYLRERRGGK